jgi:hypothetical protein
LNGRRKLEASGFRSEIRIMQDQLKKSEQLMLTLVSQPITPRKCVASPDSGMASRVSSAKSVRSDLMKVKANISKLERMLEDF